MQEPSGLLETIGVKFFMAQVFARTLSDKSETSLI